MSLGSFSMPLGGVPESRIGSALIAIVPPWLQRTNGGAIVRAFGDVLDDVLFDTSEGVRARFPGHTEDALGAIGRERRISRGYSESSTAYASRLSRWRIDHRKRGGPIAMLRQLEAFWSASPKRISIRYASGTWWTLDPTTLDADGLGTITRSTHTSNADLTRWARCSVVYELTADPGTLTYADWQAYMQIPNEWNAGHVQLRVFATWNGGGMWGEGATWGGGDTWGAGGVCISDLVVSP